LSIILYFKKFVIQISAKIALLVRECRIKRFSSLAAGGGIGKARTGGELPKSCEVSHETTPPLAPNCLLHAGIFFFSPKSISNVFFFLFICLNLQLLTPLKLRWSHIDLLFVRWTNQKEVEQIMSEKNGVEFLWKQLLISKQIIEESNPKIIVVNNSFARKLLGFDKSIKNGQVFDIWMGFDFKFDNKIGTYRITNNEILNGTPVFFTSMLTGQRALDNGSYERLIWHINYVKDRV